MTINIKALYKQYRIQVGQKNLSQNCLIYDQKTYLTLTNIFLCCIMKIQELMLQQQSQSIMGSQVEDWIQSSIEKMFNEVMFKEEE